MFIDSLSQEQMKQLVKFIGCGTRPIKAGKILFPEKDKGYVKVTATIRAYFWNKISAYNYPKERQRYTAISAEVWCSLPVWGRQIPDDILKGIIKNE